MQSYVQNQIDLDSSSTKRAHLMRKELVTS
jgi:hypothetical protein